MDHSDEARGMLAELAGRDARVRRLGRQLREAQQGDRFSQLVAEALGAPPRRDVGTTEG
jgi:hypothetical protein